MYNSTSMLKRLFEILFSLIVLTLSTPFIFFFGLIVFLEDRGNPIFCQKRLGKNKNIFTMYKLRTMKINVPNVGTHETSESMYLKSSNLIRKLKIDEFPQFFNVLIGDMSIVGPRPCLPNQRILIQEREKNNIFKHKPGITGITQIKNIMMNEEAKQAKIDSIYNYYFGVKSKKYENVILYFYCILSTLFKGKKHFRYLENLIKKHI